MKQEQRVIRILAENKPGVLMRVANIVTAKGINIERLIVAPERQPAGFSKITIVANLEPRYWQRVINELNRLVNVISATDVTKTEKEHRPPSQAD